MAEIVQARVWQKVDTYNNWMANDLILGKGEMALVVGNGGIPLNMRWGDGTKAFRYLPNAIAYDQGQFVAITGTVLPASISGQVRYSIVGQGTYTRAGQSDVVVPDGKLGIIVDDGSEWGLSGEVDLPTIQGTDVLNPAGEDIPKEKAVADYVARVLSGEVSVDKNYKPLLTSGFFINSSGLLASTTSDWLATTHFERTLGADRIKYTGRLGGSNTKLAFYANENESSLIAIFPPAGDQANRDLFEIDIPYNAKFYRVTCRSTYVNNFSIELKSTSLNKVYLFSFRQVGIPVYDENKVIKESNIVWNDGSSGVVTYDNWNENELTYAGFSATSIENKVRAVQSKVIFNSDGTIQNYPNIQFYKI